MKTTLFLAACAVLAISSCSTTSMKVEAKPVAGVDYSAYKSYKWSPLDKETTKNFTEQDKQIRASFLSEADSILSRRGFKKVDSGKSDLLIHARGVRMAGYRSVGPAPGDAASYVTSDDRSSRLGNSQPAFEGYLKEETSSSIRFLISESSTDKVVWRGKAFVSFADSRSQPLLLKDAREVARKLLEGFPPKG